MAAGIARIINAVSAHGQRSSAAKMPARAAGTGARRRNMRS